MRKRKKYGGKRKHTTCPFCSCSFRTDAELKLAGLELYALFYDEGFVMFSDRSVRSVKSVVDANRAKFKVDAEQLEKAPDLTCNLGDDAAWGDLCLEQQVEHFEAVAKKKRRLLMSSSWKGSKTCQMWTSQTDCQIREERGLDVVGRRFGQGSQ